MRGSSSLTSKRALERLWERAAKSIPDWLPMRYIDWLPTAYEVAARFSPRGRAAQTSTSSCSTTRIAARGRTGSTWHESLLRRSVSISTRRVSAPLEAC